MVNTPYKILGSESILSGHLNGVQYGVNNIETVLDMKTETATGVILDPVVDMNDETQRYRIYEATVRGWVNSPAPVIYRDGVEVAPDEYSIESGYGVITFTSQQDAESVFTADVTHVVGGSNRLDKIEDNAGGGDTTELSNRVDGLREDYNNLESRVDNLGGSSGGGGSAPNLILNINEKWLYNVQIGKYYDDTAFNPAVLSGGDTMDLFPVIIEHPISAENIATYTSNSNENNSTNNVFGIYTSVNGIPHELVAQTDNFAISGSGATYNKPLTRGKDGSALSGSVVLEKGIYFMARYNSYGISYRAIGASREEAEGVLIEITEPDNSSARNSSGSDFYAGYRVEDGAGTPVAGITALPETLPDTLSSTFRALARNNIQEMYIVPLGAGV